MIARQLRLRNLGNHHCRFHRHGAEEHQQAVLAEPTAALAKDRTKITVNGLPVWVWEITRKRTRESLAHQLCESCPTCRGRGEIKTAQTVCFEVLRGNPGERGSTMPRNIASSPRSRSSTCFSTKNHTAPGATGRLHPASRFPAGRDAASREQFDVIPSEWLTPL